MKIMYKIFILLSLASFNSLAQMPMVRFHVPKSSAAEAPDVNLSIKERNLEPMVGQKSLIPENKEKPTDELILPAQNKDYLLEETGDLEISDGPQY